MGARRRCCCGKCWTWQDYFDRTNIGSAWNVRSGSWSPYELDDDWGFGSGHYSVKEAGNAGALMVMSSAASPAPMRHRVHVWFNGPLPVGAKPRAIVNYVDDDNYYFAQCEALASGLGTLSVWKRAGGVDTLLDACSNIGQGLYVCFTDEYFSVSAGEPTAEATGEVAYVCFGDGLSRFPNGNRAGLGNGADIAVEFGAEPYAEGNHPAFNILEMWSPGKPAPDCPTCLCRCGDKCMPKTLTATYTLDNPGSYGGCDYPSLHGYSHPLTKGDAWEGTASICGFSWDVLFGCRNSFGNNQQSYMDSVYPDDELFFGSASDFIPSHPDCEALPWVAGAYSVSCDPLAIVFGPFRIEYPMPPPDVGGCACCDYGEASDLWITVTE